MRTRAQIPSFQVLEVDFPGDCNSQAIGSYCRHRERSVAIQRLPRPCFGTFGGEIRRLPEAGVSGSPRRFAPRDDGAPTLGVTGDCGLAARKGYVCGRPGAPQSKRRESLPGRRLDGNETRQTRARIPSYQRLAADFPGDCRRAAPGPAAPRARVARDFRAVAPTGPRRCESRARTFPGQDGEGSARCGWGGSDGHGGRQTFAFPIRTNIEQASRQSKKMLGPGGGEIPRVRRKCDKPKCDEDHSRRAWAHLNFRKASPERDDP